jgi:peptidoglycan/LPS O-acetylase OafA/YrhL
MNEKNHFIALDSLRGVCASIVAFFHVDGDALIKTVPFVANGFLFVDFFFVLSGFVIAASYGKKIVTGFPIGKFMFLRLGRLYPLHAFMLLAYVFIAIFRHSQGSGANYPISEFFGATLLFQAWEPHFGLDMNHWNPPSWSISAEFWTYLIFALTLRSTGKKFLLALASLIVITAPILLFGTDRAMNICFAGGGIARCVYGFSFGVIAYSIWRSGFFDGLSLSYPTATLVELTALIAGLALVSYSGSSRLGLLCPPLFSLIVIIVAYQAGAMSRFLTTKPLMLVGTLSYSIYMTHEFVLARVLNLLAGMSRFLPLPIIIGQDGFTINNTPGYVGATDVVAVAFYCVVLCVSWITYNAIENPARLWSRKFANPVFQAPVQKEAI